MIRLMTPIVETARTVQARSLFDLKCRQSEFHLDIELPLEDRPWNLGLIVGPSGCGKSSLARSLWPDSGAPWAPWPLDRSILDGFTLPIAETVELLSSVGFSSPPDWFKPFRVLSTGQQFRANLARMLAEAQPGQPVVVDEFTSTVDRTVAQIGSAATARTVRARQLQVVALTCHEDVEDWLQPDWVCRPAEATFTWRHLRGRPPIDLAISRVYPDAWNCFRRHHYLSSNLLKPAVCWCAFWRGTPVAFSAWVRWIGSGPPAWREHRTVVLPDFQGVGIGRSLSNFAASCWEALGFLARSTTSHPAFVSSRMRDPGWQLVRWPALASKHELANSTHPKEQSRRRRTFRHATGRKTAGFLWIGPPANARLAAEMVPEVD